MRRAKNLLSMLQSLVHTQKQTQRIYPPPNPPHRPALCRPSPTTSFPPFVPCRHTTLCDLALRHPALPSLSFLALLLFASQSSSFSVWPYPAPVSRATSTAFFFLPSHPSFSRHLTKFFHSICVISHLRRLLLSIRIANLPIKTIV